MTIAFNCPPVVAYPGDPLGAPLVFDWDQGSGAIRGPGSETIARLISFGEVLAGAHPRWVYELTPGAPISERDLAAIVGHAWHVPPELLPSYPQDDAAPPEMSGVGSDGIPEVTYVDSDGLVHIGRDQLTY